MENVVYEKDYAEDRQQRIAADHDETSMNVLESAIESGFFKAYSEAMHSVPKIINPIRKANFEYVQKLCDDMARQRGGKIRSEVRYDKWDAIIDLTLSFFEFGSRSELENLQEIASRVDSVTFTPEKDGGIRLHIFCYYFDDVATQEDIDEIFMEKIVERPELLRALLKKMESEGEDVSGELEKYFGTAES